VPARAEGNGHDHVGVSKALGKGDCRHGPAEGGRQPRRAAVLQGQDETWHRALVGEQGPGAGEGRGGGGAAGAGTVAGRGGGGVDVGPRGEGLAARGAQRVGGAGDEGGAGRAEVQHVSGAAREEDPASPASRGQDGVDGGTRASDQEVATRRYDAS
jgi:hypothetical protein